MRSADEIRNKTALANLPKQLDGFILGNTLGNPKPKPSDVVHALISMTQFARRNKPDALRIKTQGLITEIMRNFGKGDSGCA